MPQSNEQIIEFATSERKQLELIRDVSEKCLAVPTDEIPPKPSIIERVGYIAGDAIDYSEKHGIPVDETRFTHEQVPALREIVMTALLGADPELYATARQLQAQLPEAA